MTKPDWLTESEAAEMLGYKNPRTIRMKILGIGAYKGKTRLPVRTTPAGKGYRYNYIDVQKLIIKYSTK